MPYQTIKTREYECIRCGYKWIRRKNGIDNKVMPRFCPECKTRLWNTKYKIYDGYGTPFNPPRWYNTPRGKKQMEREKEKLEYSIRLD